MGGQIKVEPLNVVFGARVSGVKLSSISDTNFEELCKLGWSMVCLSVRLNF